MPDREHNVLPNSPWARVARISLIRREIREYLSPQALDVLFASADQVVETGLDASGAHAYATVMVTLDITKTDVHFREEADAATAARVAELMRDDRGVARRMMEIARPALARAAGVPERQLKVQLEHAARWEGTRVLVDGDAMVSLSAPREQRG